MRAAATHGRLLTFGSGGWVLLGAGILTVAVVVWALAGAIVRGGDLVGDGRNVSSYGFDLTTCLVPPDDIVASGIRKDALRALVGPPHMAGADVAEFNTKQHGKFLVSRDRVIGVTINGESRAYPLRIMQCHEVANDTLGGVPIAVTYNPLCDSVVVFERTLEDQTLEFGVSGLLYNSNLLMFDRRPQAEGESLWSQLQARALGGPAADKGLTLRVLEASLTRWSEWLGAHPETTVLEPDPRMIKRYKETSYQVYFRSPGLMFPVSPETPADGPRPKERVVVVKTGSARRVFPVSTIARRADADGIWRSTLERTGLRFLYRKEPETVTVLTDAEPMETMYAFWFAWHAMYPGDEPVM